MRLIELVVLALVLANAALWPTFNPWWTCIPWIAAAVFIQRFVAEDR